MNLSLRIAQRYLFSPKKQKAVNIISIIGTAGLCIGTFALISVLSVFNGIDSVIRNTAESITPSIVITDPAGKFSVFERSFIDSLKRTEHVVFVEEVLSDNAMLKYRDRMRPVKIKGICTEYVSHTDLENKIVAGKARTKGEDGRTDIIAGYGIAADLSLEFSTREPVLVYYPDKDSRKVASSALRTVETSLGGVFSYDQTEDNKLVYIDIEEAQTLFKCPGCLSALEIYTDKEEYIDEVKETVAGISKDRFSVKDKYEINSNFYSMMRGEKLAVFIIMIFVLLIASFNIIASISMLLIDKKENLFLFRALGMHRHRIKRIFLTEGLIMVTAGVVSGLLLACLFTIIQEKFGWIKLGDGEYISEAYPVKLVFSDVLAASVAVVVIGITAVMVPIRILINKWIAE